MPMTLEEIARAARELSPDDREILFHTLVEDIPPDEQKRIDDLWRKEIDRRHTARIAGTARSRPLAEAIQDIRAELNARSRNR